MLKEENNKIEITIDTEEAIQKSSVANTMYNEANSLVIQNQTQYDEATLILKAVKTKYKELDEQRKEITLPLDVAKKNIMNLYKTPLELLTKAEEKIKSLLLQYARQKEAEALEERKRLQKLAEQEAEKQRKLIEEKIARAQASEKLNEEEKLNKIEELEQIKETVQSIPVPVIQPNIAKPQGLSYKEIWHAEVIDFNALPNEYKLPNQSALDKIAQSTKGSIKIPGVAFKSEKIVAVRS